MNALETILVVLAALAVLAWFAKGVSLLLTPKRKNRTDHKE